MTSRRDFFKFIGIAPVAASSAAQALAKEFAKRQPKMSFLGIDIGTVEWSITPDGPFDFDTPRTIMRIARASTAGLPEHSCRSDSHYLSVSAQMLEHGLFEPSDLRAAAGRDAI